MTSEPKHWSSHLTRLKTEEVKTSCACKKNASHSRSLASTIHHSLSLKGASLAYLHAFATYLMSPTNIFPTISSLSLCHGMMPHLQSLEYIAQGNTCVN